MIYSSAVRLGVYALTLLGAMSGTVVGVFELLPEGRSLRIILLAIAAVCVVCNLWLKWQDEADSAEKTRKVAALQSKLNSQSLMIETLMANSMPSKKTVESVVDRFAHVLFLSNWKEFSVSSFQSSDELLYAFILRNPDTRKIARIMWIHQDEINRLATVADEAEFMLEAKTLINKPELCSRDLDEAWNGLSHAFMPVFLFAFESRNVHYDSQGKQIFVPLPSLDINTYKDKPFADIADNNGVPCVWICLDREFLSSILGLNRSQISEAVISYLQKLGI